MDKDLPWPFTCFTNYVVMVVGCVIVMIVCTEAQSKKMTILVIGQKYAYFKYDTVCSWRQNCPRCHYEQIISRLKFAYNDW